MTDNIKTDVKFTETELEKIKSFQQQYVNIQLAFGQIELSKMRFDEQLTLLDESYENTAKDLNKTQKEEREFIDDINKKYGDGVLDPQTGVFTPRTEIE